MADEGSDWPIHAARIREEIKEVSERADSLERILPSLPDDETRRKMDLVIQS